MKILSVASYIRKNWWPEFYTHFCHEQKQNYNEWSEIMDFNMYAS